MKGITAKELKAILQRGEYIQLIDVREPDEHAEFNIGGILIPLNEIGWQIEKVATDRPVILYCRKGIRSQFAIQKLEEKFPFNNLYNLIGGMEEWKRETGNGNRES